MSLDRKDITALIKNIKKSVEAHKIETGAYIRYTHKEGEQKANEYGCADAANILYTIGEFPTDVEERKKWVEILQNMQDKETGMFYEDTHYPMHTTAHCLAALELFDVKPLYPLTGLEMYKTKDGLYKLLESLPWKDSSWSGSHKGAGIYAALNLAGEATPEWNDWYFEWLWNESDPETGMWRKGYTDKERPRQMDMVASFHYLFNHEYARMPLRYPEKMIDSCIEMYEKGYLNDKFGKSTGFIEVDWVYCITRALRQCGHRFDDCKKVVRKFADSYLDALMAIDPDQPSGFDDIHMLFGTVCCVAEIQQFLPGYLYTEKPLKLVLDRRPFI